MLKNYKEYFLKINFNNSKYIIFQNEKKYDDSKIKYEKILNDCTNMITKILNNRFNLINPVVMKVFLIN